MGMSWSYFALIAGATKDGNAGGLRGKVSSR